MYSLIYLQSQYYRVFDCIKYIPVKYYLLYFCLKIQYTIFETEIKQKIYRPCFPDWSHVMLESGWKHTNFFFKIAKKHFPFSRFHFLVNYSFVESGIICTEFVVYS
jgi:hypothetical protein